MTLLFTVVTSDSYVLEGCVLNSFNLEDYNMVEPTRVLVIDDDEAILYASKIALESSGYIVTTAMNGKEGLALITSDSEKFDIIVTDYKMPEMNGLEFLNEVRLSDNPKIYNIPAIVRSAEESIKGKCNELGATFMLKPGEAYELEKTVEDVLTEQHESGP